MSKLIGIAFAFILLTSHISITVCTEIAAKRNKHVVPTNLLALGTRMTWRREFDKAGGSMGDDWGSCVQQTKDGGYIIVGCTTSVDADIWLIKTDENGRKVWDKTFGSNNSYEGGEGVQQTEDGGYVIVGYIAGNVGMWDIWLIKTDENGNKVWDRVFDRGYDYGEWIQQTKDGGYIIVGWTVFNRRRGYDIWLIKTDENGNKVWDRVFDRGGCDDIGHYVQQTKDGGYIIVGWTISRGTGYDIWLIKVDKNGKKEWDKIFGGKYADEGACVQQTRDGGYIIVGYTCSGDECIDPDIWLIKVDENGKKVWDKIFGENIHHEIGICVQQTRDGGYIITGYTDSFISGDSDILLIKTDKDGNKIWSRVYRDIFYIEYGVFVQQTRDGGYIILGSAAPIISGQRITGGNYLYHNPRIVLLKTDENGELRCIRYKIGDLIHRIVAKSVGATKSTANLLYCISINLRPNIDASFGSRSLPRHQRRNFPLIHLYLPFHFS